MQQPVLVLQYPDSRQCRTVALAVTRNPKALKAFRDAVLEDARLASLDWLADEVLRTQEQAELGRLERLLNLLIPDSEEREDSCGQERS